MMGKDKQEVLSELRAAGKSDVEIEFSASFQGF
jgi:hypothetical protein